MTYDSPPRRWRTPRVSVIVPAYNAARYVCQSVDSILGQTFADFELIVVDDCSTDDTAALLAGYDDPRLRVIHNERNQGVVEARNTAWRQARGEYIAAFDADDVSLPTRLARQVAFLDANPSVALVSTETLYLEAGMLRPGHRVPCPNPTPELMRWLLHVGNPFAHPALMYRASAIRRLGILLREECKYAEDFDLYHRIIRTDDVALLDEPLVLYRRHPGAITSKHEPEMIDAAGRVLAGAYRAAGFGADADAAAALIAKYVLAVKPPEGEAVLVRLREVLSRLVEGFLGAREASFREMDRAKRSIRTSPGWTAADRDAVLEHASGLWWQAVRSAVRSGRIGALAVAPPDFAATRRGGFPRAQVPVSVASGLAPGPLKSGLRSAFGTAFGAAKAVASSPGRAGAVRLFGVEYEPLPDDERPPTLYAVVDCGAGFGRARDPVRAASAVAGIECGQAVFDRYGLRPVYAVDYPVASRPAECRSLHDIHDRGGCEIGALLDPWTTPPFGGEGSAGPSRAGAPSPESEERKLTALLDAIRRAFRVSPLFFKAARHGIGPNTMAIVARHGIRVDLSVVPGLDCRPTGGPDFRGFDAAPRSLLGGRLLSVPMTRGVIGPLSPLGGMAARAGERSPALETPFGVSPPSGDGSPSEIGKGREGGPMGEIGTPGALARLGLLEPVALAPDVPAGKQIALIRAMLARGQRCFVLHYRGASLAPGHAPPHAPSSPKGTIPRSDVAEGRQGARTPGAADEALRGLEEVCRFFFETLGGVPGTMSDLLAPPLRVPDRRARDGGAGLAHGRPPTGAPMADAADTPDGA